MLFTICSVSVAIPAAAEVQYGVLFEGLPAEGENTVSKNGVEFVGGEIVEDGEILLLPISERIDSTLKFNANSSLEGIVTFSFNVTTCDPAPQFVVGLNDIDKSGHRLVVLSSTVADSEYVIELEYNTSTAEYSIYVNGKETAKPEYQPTVGEGITDVTFGAYSPNTAMGYLTNAKITYDPLPITGYGTYFNGLPESGLSKTQNGVVFDTKIDTAGYGTITNSNGVITMTTSGTYKALDAKLSYLVNNTIEGTVKYTFEVNALFSVPSLYIKYFTGSEDKMGANFSVNANQPSTIVFEYDAQTGAYTIYLNGVAKATSSVDASTGISSVYFRAMSGSGNGEAIELTNAKVERVAPPMTGYGTYFKGLPTSGFEKEENGVGFETKIDTAGCGIITNNSGKIEMTTYSPTPWRAIDSILSYGADNTIDGTVEYGFMIESGSSVPNVYLKYFTDGQDKEAKEITAFVVPSSKNSIKFIYNPAKGDWSAYVNDALVANGVVDKTAGIDKVYIRIMSPSGEEQTVTLLDATLDRIEPETEGVTTYLKGLPLTGLTKSSNGANFSVKVDSEGNAVNDNGIITMNTSGRYKAITTALEFKSGSAYTGIFTYEFNVKTSSPVPEFYVKYYSDDYEEMGSFISVPANKDSVISFEYDTVSGDWKILLNGEDVAEDYVDPEIGIDSVILICMSSSGNGESAALTNAKITQVEPPMTGYGTYLSGIPASGLEKQENGAKFYIAYENLGNAENNGDAIEMTTAGGWGKAVLPTVEFDADDTLNGIVTYEFTFYAETKGPQALYFRLNDDTDNYNLNVVSGSGDGYIPIFDGATNPTGLHHTMVLDGTTYTFGIAYNTVTGDIAVTYAGHAATNASYNTTIEGSTRKKINPQAGLSKVALAVFSGSADSVNYLTDVKVEYYPFDNMSDIQITKDNQTKEATASVNITKAPYFSSIPSEYIYAIAAYKGNKLTGVSYTNADIINGEKEYSVKLDIDGVDYDTLKAFLWETNLSPIAVK